jgi:hypothetical protein
MCGKLQMYLGVHNSLGIIGVGPGCLFVLILFRPEIGQIEGCYVWG